MWVPELLLPPKIIRMFDPKTAIFAPKYAFLGTYRPCRLIWCLVGWWLWCAGNISQDTYLLYVISIGGCKISTTAMIYSHCCLRVVHNVHVMLKQYHNFRNIKPVWGQRGCGAPVHSRNALG